jgi:hypothetical protein
MATNHDPMGFSHPIKTPKIGALKQPRGSCRAPFSGLIGAHPARGVFAQRKPAQRVSFMVSCAPDEWRQKERCNGGHASLHLTMRGAEPVA